MVSWQAIVKCPFLPAGQNFQHNIQDSLPRPVLLILIRFLVLKEPVKNCLEEFWRTYWQRRNPQELVQGCLCLRLRVSHWEEADWKQKPEPLAYPKSKCWWYSSCILCFKGALEAAWTSSSLHSAYRMLLWKAYSVFNSKVHYRQSLDLEHNWFLNVVERCPNVDPVV